MLFKRLFSRDSRPEEQTDYQSLQEEGAGSLESEYEKLVAHHLQRWGVSDKCATVEALQRGQDEQGRPEFVVLLRLVGWQRIAALRLLVGLPLLERKIRRILPALWVSDVSRFGGIWLHAGGELQQPPAVAELRQVVVSLTGRRAKAVGDRRGAPSRPIDL